jgi:DNA polymerase I-like protein with 3'-5' exonuclease and polymerase domains
MAKAAAKVGRNDVQVPLFHALAGDWRPPDVSSLPQWPERGRVSIDFETRDDQIKSLGPGVRRGAYIVGFSFAIEETGFATYIPLRHASGDNVPDPQKALQYLRDQAKRFRGPGTVLTGGNLQYDLDFAEQEGIEFRPEWIRDIQVADPLINELHDSYSVAAICLRRGIEGKDEAELRQGAKDWGLDPKQELWKLPGRYAFKYGVGDAMKPLQVLKMQDADIAAQELQGIFDLESRVLPVLLKMRRRGVLIDQPHLQRVEDWSIVQGNKALEEVKAHTGRTLSLDDVMKPAAVAPILELIGVRLDTTTLGKPSIDKDLLDKLDHRVAVLLGRARRLYKLRNTFVASVREHMVNGRVHSTFNQLRGSSAHDNEIEGVEEEKGARYGRLSSCDPNIQQQPSRDHKADEKEGLTYAKMWRAIYIPEPGMEWAACDFSQQEPRVLTHYAELCGCRKARDFGDKYRKDPKADTYDGLSAMTKTKRGQTKTIYLGLSYSMGGAKLCRSLGLPTVWKPGRDGKLREMAGPEGEALFRAFHDGAPFIKELNYKIQDAIQERGYIKTLLGRRIHFPKKDIPTQNPVTGKMEYYDWSHKGLNRLIQGSSADQTKMAVVMLDEAGHFLQLQVHDEVDASVKGREEGEAMADIMRNAVKLTVPMRVDVEIGKSWGHSMGYTG